ncbi:MAG: anti-sigma factor domain-containing protein [Bacillota bacterium]
MRHKGILTEVKGKKGIILTPRGEFVQVTVSKGAKIGSEIEFSRKPSVLPLVAGFIILLLISFSVLNTMNPAVAAYVALDFNSGIELGLDKNLKVVSVKALDSSGEKIINNVHVKGKPLEVAVATIAGEAAKQRLSAGAGHEDEDIVFVTITTGFAELAYNEEEIKDLVIKNIHKNDISRDIIIGGATLEEWDAAKEKKIRPGKYVIMKRMQAAGLASSEDLDNLISIPVEDLVKILREKELKDEKKVVQKDNPGNVDHNIGFDNDPKDKDIAIQDGAAPTTERQPGKDENLPSIMVPGDKGNGKQDTYRKDDKQTNKHDDKQADKRDEKSIDKQNEKRPDKQKDKEKADETQELEEGTSRIEGDKDQGSSPVVRHGQWDYSYS